jgi:outer membrane protein assembly factor BamB
MNKKINRRIILSLPFILFVFLIFSGLAAPQSENWTHFRGSDMKGVASGKSYPVEWNDSTNIAWFTPIEGRAWSSPVVFEDQIWLTNASPDGKEMSAICLDLNSGKEIFNIELFKPETIYGKHAINSYATPTSAIESGFVYVHFGRYGTACIDTRNGQKLWERTDLQCEHIQGPGSSLLLHGNKLIVHMEGTDVQNIYALDKTTGKTIWMASRDPKLYESMLEIGKKAYVTPIVVEVNGREIIISNGSAVCNAYDIETGEEVWYIPQGEDSTISMPLEYNGIIYFYTGFITPEEGDKYCELWAVDPKGEGNLSSNIIWRKKFPILQLLTPVIHDNLLFTVDTESELYCINAVTGETIWSEKIKGKYNSSPIWAGGNVYLSTTRGETLVFESSKSFKKISENKLNGEIWATPAFVNGTILIRTSKGLVKVEA